MDGLQDRFIVRSSGCKNRNVRKLRTDAAHDLRRRRRAGHIEKISPGLDPAADVHLVGNDCRNHRDVDNLLDAGNDFIGNRRIDDDPESSLIFRLNRQPDRAVSACDPTADADKDRYVRDTDYRLRNCRLWCKGINGDDCIGIDVLNDRHVCCKCNGFDAHSKNADAAAFADAVRQPDAVIPQCAVIDRNVSFCHGRLLSLSRIDNRILSIILRQSSGFNSDL